MNPENGFINNNSIIIEVIEESKQAKQKLSFSITKFLQNVWSLNAQFALKPSAHWKSLLPNAITCSIHNVSRIGLRCVEIVQRTTKTLNWILGFVFIYKGRFCIYMLDSFIGYSNLISFDFTVQIKNKSRWITSTIFSQHIIQEIHKWSRNKNFDLAYKNWIRLMVMNSET